MDRLRFWGRRPWFCLVVIMLLAAVRQVAGEESCTKRVFNKYCLGGEVKELINQPPAPEFQQQNGQRLALVYPEGRYTMYVMAFKGRIYKVLRKYKFSTLLQYDDLMRLLSEKYGQPENLSQFPEYAEAQSSRIGAIRRGEGRAVYVWRSEGDPWHIVLSWTRELGLALAYLDDELDTAQKQAQDSGF